MNQWLVALQADLKNEFETKPPTAIFATVRMIDGVPAATARTVVVRDIDSGGAMLIASDARSTKNAEVRRSPKATLLFWLPSVKRQYRVEGKVDLSIEHRARVWSKLSDRARALFAWPPPGKPREETTFVGKVSADTPMPVSFEVLRLTPMEVESLDLNSHPHERVRWTQAGAAWNSDRLNP